jgi:hypothetical protein
VLERTPDSLVFTETLTVEPEAATRITVVLDPSDFTMRYMDQTGNAGAQRSEVHLHFVAGRVTGRATVPQPNGSPQEITIDTAPASGPYYTEFAGNVIVRALRLRPSAAFTFPVFAVADRSVKMLKVQVAGVDSLSVPAGAFRAFKVDVSGGAVPFVFYVSESVPRRVLKVEIVGTPVTFELAR